MDRVAKEIRSKIMGSVRSKGTGPEMVVRSAAHRLGLRFRLHRTDLPGKPDLVFPKCKTVVFVNGCFWHQHLGCPKASIPKSNVDFWRNKFSRNIARDQCNYSKLEELGWSVVVVWQCEVKTIEDAKNILRQRLPSVCRIRA